MAVETVNAQDKQGTIFNVKVDGVKVTFGRELRNLILINPAAGKRVYFTMGDAGMLSSTTPSAAASLASSFPFLEPGEKFQLDNGQVHPLEAELRTATGDTTTGFRVIKV